MKLIATDCAISCDGRHRLAYYDSVEGEFGLVLGQLHPVSADPPEDPGDFEVWLAETTIGDGKFPGTHLDRNGWYWPSNTAASNVLRAIKEAIKYHRSNNKTSLPDWALKALSEGWKPPKKWKP